MLHRLLASVIVLFWLVMTGILVIREIYPEGAALNSVPASYVGRMMFQHQQSSDLEIYSGGRDIGYLHLLPKPPGPNGEHPMEFHGNIKIDLPNGIRQRLSWVGTLELDHSFSSRRLQLVLTLQDVAQQLDLDLDLTAKKGKYAIKNGTNKLEESTVSLDEKGLSDLLVKAGINPALLSQLPAMSSVKFPDLEAEQSSTRLNGESVGTFRLSMHLEGQTLFECHVSQLGQVLRINFPLFGYKLAPHNIAP